MTSKQSHYGLCLNSFEIEPRGFKKYVETFVYLKIACEITVVKVNCVSFQTYERIMSVRYAPLTSRFYDLDGDSVIVPEHEILFSILM